MARLPCRARASTGTARRERVRRRLVGQRADVRRARCAGDPRPHAAAERTTARVVGRTDQSRSSAMVSGSADSAARRTPSAIADRRARAFTIVGVTPPQFFGVDVGRTFDVAVPMGTVTLMQGARVARAALDLVAADHDPTEAGPERGGQAPRCCAPCSRRSVRRRCRTTGTRVSLRGT